MLCTSGVVFLTFSRQFPNMMTSFLRICFGIFLFNYSAETNGRIKKEAADLVTSSEIHDCPSVPTLALSKSGNGSKVIPSSQPVIQAPRCLIVIYIIQYFTMNFQWFSGMRKYNSVKYKDFYYSVFYSVTPRKVLSRKPPCCPPVSPA